MCVCVCVAVCVHVCVCRLNMGKIMKLAYLNKVYLVLLVFFY